MVWEINYLNRLLLML